MEPNFKTYRHADGCYTSFTFSVSDHVLNTMYMPHILKEVAERVITELTKEWIAKHGVELLNNLSPTAIEDAVKTTIAKKVLT